MICIFTTNSGVEIDVECDEICENIPEDSLTANYDGHSVRIFSRSSMLCWEEIAKATETLATPENGSVRSQASI